MLRSPCGPLTVPLEQGPGRSTTLPSHNGAKGPQTSAPEEGNGQRPWVQGIIVL